MPLGLNFASWLSIRDSPSTRRSLFMTGINLFILISSLDENRSLLAVLLGLGCGYGMICFVILPIRFRAEAKFSSGFIFME